MDGDPSSLWYIARALTKLQVPTDYELLHLRAGVFFMCMLWDLLLDVPIEDFQSIIWCDRRCMA